MTHPLLRVRDLTVHFETRKGLFGKRQEPVKAVDGVSFDLHRGETLALVGESGSGKSTTGYAVLGLVNPTAGQILLDGEDLAGLAPAARRRLATRMQIISQDPAAALDPRFTLFDSVAEPLRLQQAGSETERRERVEALFDSVGLAPSLTSRYPNQVSGGQRQRVVIARAIALNPALIVCDEAVSALDVSIRSQILNLLMDFQERLGLAYLFISHDLSVVRHISDRVGVMQAGRIIEQASTDDIFVAPRQTYTRALLQSIPLPDPSHRGRFATHFGPLPQDRLTNGDNA